MNAFALLRPKAAPGKCSGVKNPMQRRNSYAGFQIESRAQSQASVDKRMRISKTGSK